MAAKSATAPNGRERPKGSALFRDLTTHIGLAPGLPDRTVVDHQPAVRSDGDTRIGAKLLALAFAGKLHLPAELSIGGDLAGAAARLVPIETVAAFDTHAIG